MIYAVREPGAPLEQGDILDGCPLFILDPDTDLTLGPDKLRPECVTSRVIVLTQSCDIAQGKADRVVVAPVHEAGTIVRRGELKPQTIRDSIRRGAMFGWYFLPAARVPAAFPESIIDLRDLHTIPLKAMSSLAKSGKRVVRLVTPFREHMAQHLGVTYMRIGLPEPYPTEDASPGA
ncbi:MAG: hypothetical protein K2W96_05495 [Gemmataceae bacterium]|nr:hypothetical protein [Gemmataceae bacterium]